MPLIRSDTASRRASFDGLYERHHRAVLAFALRRTRTAADAEDATSETFIIAWRRLETAPPEPLPWLYGITRRVLANQRRGTGRLERLRVRLRAQPLEPVVPSPASADPTDPFDPDDSPAFAALARLRADDQELLRLVAWEEFSHSQIAMVLGISVNAVAIRVHRARGRFVQALEEEGRKGSGPSRTPGPVKGRTFGRIRREQME
ncbi:MAG: RNA polymerase sigma factor [Chloroflexi bacterium]|nr:RNA polymerase sigma factor [Chloroflexota bacterium]